MANAQVDDHPVRFTFSDQTQPESRLVGSAQESDFVPKPPIELMPERQLDSPSDQIRNQNESKANVQQDAMDRQTDEPMAAPTFELRRNERPGPPDRGNLIPGSDSVRSPTTDETYLLPRVANVHAPISLTPLANLAQDDPSGLLRGPAELNHQAVDSQLNYSQIVGAHEQSKWKTWQAPNFYHGPLYFEDPNLEQFGNELSFQKIGSAVRFFRSLPSLPYRIGRDLPRDRVYTHGQARPGDCVPYETQVDWKDKRGMALQSIVALGIILP